MDRRFDEIIEKIKTSSRFMVVSHVNPEGDAIGSLLGLSIALKALGKDVTPYLEDPVPDVFKFLPGADTVVHTLEGAAPFDAVFAVDCGKIDRLGRRYHDFKGYGFILNIAHHTTNDLFGDLNVIAPEESATGEVIYDFCKAASIDITRDIAINLYVAIHTDTGSFRYSSSSADSFIKAGDLVRRGADPWDISRRVYENNPVKKYKLLGMVLSTLDVMSVEGAERNGSIATMLVTLDMFTETAAEKDLADGFVNYARGIEGVEVGVLFRECPSGEYKVSLRSKGYVDVARVAEIFGGGGHSHAAGCTVEGDLDTVKTKVIGAIKEEMTAAGKA